MSELIPPGWYPDPEQVGVQRYWDGNAWTDQRAHANPQIAAATGTNGLAIASFVLSVFWALGVGSVLAIIFGFRARSQIRTSRESGDGFALAGIVIGFLGLIPAAILLLAVTFGSLVSTTLDAVGGWEAGSGRIESVTPSVNEFSRLTADSSFDVEIRTGEAFGVVVRTDDNLLDAVQASVSGETLTLSLRGNYRDVTLEATVTVPNSALSAISTSGAATVVSQGQLASDVFVVEASGASRVVLRLDSNNLTVDASGASTIEVTGAGDVVDAEVSGASTVSLAGFNASAVMASADGASTMDVTATTSLDATASGASKIRYGGNPTDVTADASGGSTIESR